MIVDTRYARNGRASIAYQVVGHGDVDLVFIPCWVSHLDTLWEEPRFARWIERLSAFGRVILFDKRGTGLSDPASAFVPATLEQRLDDLRAVLDAAGSRRVVPIGVSLGSPLSALFAATYPERAAGLVMFGGTARRTWAPDYPWAPTASQHEQLRERLRAGWGGPFDLELFAPSLAADARFRAWWAAYLRRSASLSAALTAERLDAAIDVRHLLPTIRVPTVVIHRAGDRVVDVAEGRYLAAQIPGARYVELAGADHIPFAGDQDAITDEIGRFVTGRATAAKRPRAVATVVAVAPHDASATAMAARCQTDGAQSAADTELLGIARPALARFGGRNATRTATGFVASFDAPARAVEFAAAVVEAARRSGLRAVAGLHTGEVEIRVGGIGGPAVRLAGWVAARARPGDVLVSRTVRDLVAGSGLAFEPADSAVSGDLPSEWRLYRHARETAVPRLAPTGGLAARAVGSRPAALSRREREVAALVARGLSNRELAAELSISVSTAERHVTNILTKLGFRSRTQVAVWATAELPGTPGPALRALARPAPRPAVAAA